MGATLAVALNGAYVFQLKKSGDGKRRPYNCSIGDAAMT
jgi:hypothetical protein